MKKPSPGSYLGGFGRAGDGTVEIGAALTTMIRRPPVACIACTMALVPRQATPASDAEAAPSAEITASAPLTADSSTAGSGDARSALTPRNWLERFLGFRPAAVAS